MKTLINTIVLALVMSLSFSTSLFAVRTPDSFVKRPYVEVNMKIDKRIEGLYNMTLNYDKSKKSWITLDSPCNVKTITCTLDDGSIVTIKRSCTSVSASYYLNTEIYGTPSFMIQGNTKSCSEVYLFKLSKKNAKLLSEHDIKKISFNDKEYDTNFCLFGFYYILDNKYDAKKNHTKSDYDWYK